jgi:hypothetical protein
MPFPRSAVRFAEEKTEINVTQNEEDFQFSKDMQ